MAGRKNYSKKKTKVKRYQLIFYAMVVLTATIVYHFVGNPPAKPIPGEEMRVHFIDVGQGDSSLIQVDGKNILIDAGENEEGQTVVQYLHSQGVTKVDLLIGTHPHSDHIGGLDTVINQFDIGEIVLPELTGENIPTTKTYLEVLQAAEQKGYTITPAEPNLQFQFGEAILTILGPLKEYNEANSNSVVSKIVYGETSFLIAGDMEDDAEEDLLNYGVNVRATVFKLNHHGSNTSNSQKFLDAVRPKYCVISVGNGNSYGHPHQEILDRIKDIPTYRTDQDGTVVFSSDGAQIQIHTQR